MTKLMMTIFASIAMCGLAACGGPEGAEELAESESAAYPTCTQLLANEDMAYRNYVNCSRAHGGYAAHACTSQRQAWNDAYAAAETRGCFG